MHVKSTDLCFNAILYFDSRVLNIKNMFLETKTTILIKLSYYEYTLAII